MEKKRSDKNLIPTIQERKGREKKESGKMRKAKHERKNELILV